MNLSLYGLDSPIVLSFFSMKNDNYGGIIGFITCSAIYEKEFTTSFPGPFSLFDIRTAKTKGPGNEVGSVYICFTWTICCVLAVY